MGCKGVGVGVGWKWGEGGGAEGVRGEGRSSSDKRVEEVEWTRRREVGKERMKQEKGKKAEEQRRAGEPERTDPNRRCLSLRIGTNKYAGDTWRPAINPNQAVTRP